MECKWIRTALAKALLLALAMPTVAQQFTQADLEKMVAELDAVTPRNERYAYPIKCSVVENDDVNAYATMAREDGGGKPRATMVVFTGLVKFCNGDRRIIRAVVAHEVNHLARGHVKTVGETPAARDANQLWGRQEEHDADICGAISLQKAGFSKQDMVDMLLKLETLRGRRGSWFGRLTGSHPDPKARAAEIADDPKVLRSLLQFDVALAYMDSRQFATASRLFQKAAELEPRLTEAWINSAQSALMHYYDSLPGAVQERWFRPDFGPTLTDTSVTFSRDPEIRDSDRERYKLAIARIQAAQSKVSGSAWLNELADIARVLHPEDTTSIGSGVQTLQKLLEKLPDGADKLRVANNLALGMHRLGNLRGAYDAMMNAQKATNLFNKQIGENLGRVEVDGRSKELDTLAANVMLTWLRDTPSNSPKWGSIKGHLEATCRKLGIETPKIEQKPIYLCNPLSMTVGGTELSLLTLVDDVVAAMGRPELVISFDERFKDLTEMRWKGGSFSIFTERGNVMRLTTYEDGSSLLLKPRDSSLTYTLKISVGMSESDFGGILSIAGGTKKMLARGGELEEWLYYPSINMGVLLADGKVKGITLSPIASR